MEYEIINLKSLGDERGDLVVFDKDQNAPFDVRRVFYMFDVKGSARRGMHANRHSSFLFVALHGSCKVLVDDGESRNIVELDSPRKALRLGRMLWKEMFDFTPDAMLLVLSDSSYDSGEYIADYDEFLKIKNRSS